MLGRVFVGFLNRTLPDFSFFGGSTPYDYIVAIATPQRPAAIGVLQYLKIRTKMCVEVIFERHEVHRLDNIRRINPLLCHCLSNRSIFLTGKTHRLNHQGGWSESCLLAEFRSLIGGEASRYRFSMFHSTGIGDPGMPASDLRKARRAMYCPIGM